MASSIQTTQSSCRYNYSSPFKKLALFIVGFCVVSGRCSRSRNSGVLYNHQYNHQYNDPMLFDALGRLNANSKQICDCLHLNNSGSSSQPLSLNPATTFKNCKYYLGKRDIQKILISDAILPCKAHTHKDKHQSAKFPKIF